jgi:hypothetical protein
MTQEQFQNECGFCAVIAIASAMLAQGTIDEADFTALRRNLLERYQPVCLQAEERPP